jgi:hypothetical protein
VRLVGVEGCQLDEGGLSSRQALLDQLHLGLLPLLAGLHDRLPLQLRDVLQDVADEPVRAALSVLGEGAVIGVEGGSELTSA